MRIEKQNIPAAAKSKINQRFRNFESDIDGSKRKLRELSDHRNVLFGNRYQDDPTVDSQLEQRQQLLSGTDRLDRSSQRLRESQRIANETEDIGRGTLADLHVQREQIQNTRMTILESEGYVDRSVKTLRGMARRYSPPTTPSVLECPYILTEQQDGYESDYNGCHHHGIGTIDHCRDLLQV